jgi:iron complex transport system substrate-binding protein
VVLAEDPGGVVAQLHKLQVPVVLEPPAMSLTAVYQQISQLAQATGHAGNANAVIARIQGQIAQSVRSVPRPRKPLLVYHELEPTFFSANSRTFVGQLYTLLGLKNIADAAHGPTNYPQLSAEYVIARDPDLIVLADTVCCGQSAAKLRARPGWSNIAAVRNGNVLAVNDAIASQWGPRIVLFMQAVAAAVRKAEVSQR